MYSSMGFGKDPGTPVEIITGRSWMSCSSILRAALMAWWSKGANESGAVEAKYTGSPFMV